MLFLVNRTAARSRAVAEVARELGLIVMPYGSAAELETQLEAGARRIVLVDEADLEACAVPLKTASMGVQPLAVLAVAEKRGLQLKGLVNVEWISDAEDVDTMRHATRLCWQRMLSFSETELSAALERGQFVIQYQPKVERGAGVEWRTGEAESLIRWRHPEHGLLGPLEFLPEVEAFGLMGDVTEHVLAEAARQLARWRKQGMDLKSCINLSPSLLDDTSLPERYAGIVEAAGESPSSFTFEVPENDVRQTEAPHLKVLQKFRDRGFRISLDDFGVAASSLSAFEQLPFDEIKIHAAALRRAKANPIARKVLAAVTGLAHNLGISVCAEGVEDQEMFEFLKTIQCDKMQGFLISEAVMPDIIRHAYHTADQVDEVA